LGTNISQKHKGETEDDKHYFPARQWKAPARLHDEIIKMAMVKIKI